MGATVRTGNDVMAPQQHAIERAREGDLRRAVGRGDLPLDQFVYDGVSDAGVVATAGRLSGRADALNRAREWLGSAERSGTRAPRRD